MAMCYKDRSFCSAPCRNLNCDRNYTDEIHEQARKWWAHDPENVPVAFMDFSGKCEEYDPR